MEISPAVDAPRSGDPITAAWAANLATAVNSSANPADEVGSVSTPFGKTSPQSGAKMLGDAERVFPFDCKLVDDSGTQHLYCFIPAAYKSKVVSVFGKFASPWDGSIGGWVDMGAITENRETWLVLYLPQPATIQGIYTNFDWKLALLQTSSPQRPGDAWAETPLIPIAIVYTEWYGLVQLRHGAMQIGMPTWIPYGDKTTNFCGAIGDEAGNEMFAFASNQISANAALTNFPNAVEFRDDVKLTNAATLYVNGSVYAPSQIKDGDGNLVTVLKKQ